MVESGGIAFLVWERASRGMHGTGTLTEVRIAGSTAASQDVMLHNISRSAHVHVQSNAHTHALQTTTNLERPWVHAFLAI
ncbi:uncharacterized protein CTRU02_200521 [Colletotrichum truncatum]|uniref:Uncharacterized protein n=1 Tax=Colletotrichum truncatum TaxID=5467 RepID=A0ACC3ZEU2_COLTU